MHPPDSGKKTSFMAFFRSRFITGMLVALPLVITVFFARFLFNLLDRWSYPITEKLFGHWVPGVGAAVAIVLVFVLGMLAHNVLGRRLLRFGDRLIGRVPVLRAVYTGAREVTRAFSGTRAKTFRRVVLVPFPIRESWVVGFLTAEFQINTAQGPQRMCSVFMPSTPNPTTGFYLIYPFDMVRDCGLSIEDAIRMVMSGGLVTPDPRRIFAMPDQPPSPP
jgi:uncharacterized membrane protein